MEHIKKKMDIKKVSIAWKIAVVVLLATIIFIVATRFATAETVKVEITGEQLDDGTWEAGGNNILWKATAYDADANAYFDLETGGTITWISSDENVVDVSSSISGSESTAVLRPLSAGTVTITAKFSKIVSTDDGDYEITSEASRKVVVKFKVNETSLPTAPFEDDWTVQNVTTNSSNAVTWSSDNESVATVTDDGNGNGVITLVGAGKTIITAIASDGQKEQFPIVVNARYMETASKIDLKQDEYYTLTTNAKHGSNIHFMSSNPDIVTVDSDGTVKGMSAGRAMIYVYTLDEADPWYSLQPSPMRSIPVNVRFEILTESKSVAVDDTLQAVTNISAADTNHVNWTSSNTSVATVSPTGEITAHRKGTVTITASVVSDTIFGTNDIQTASIEITVIDSFGLSETEHILNIGDSFELEAIVTDNAATVTWSSSDESIATVSTSKNDKYKVTIDAKGKGVATITATQIIEGVTKTATCEVSVKEPVTGIEISPSFLDLTIGSSYRLLAVFKPSRPDNTNLTWVSSDEDVVTVDDMGVVKAVGGGQAAVSVITEDGIKVASCTVSVRQPVTDIKLEVNEVHTSLATGSYQLTYTISPDEDGVNKEVTWTSSAPHIATVSPNGLVTFLAPGKATIVVKTVDTGVDGNLIDTCEFYINNPVTSLDLDYTNITLKLNEQFRLTAAILPEDASNKNVIWSSSDTNVVTVSDTGMVTAVGSGSATILAKSEDSGATSMCNVTVYQPVTSLVISSETMSIRKGREFWLNVTALPENAMNKEVVWSSNDETIATVDKNGKVTTLEAGSCVITATSVDSGVTAKCTVTVLQPITGISLNESTKTILKGEKFILVPSITPIDADNKNVKWSSSDTSIATVDGSGIVTGLKGGVAIIVCTTEERGLVASCSVTVQEFVSKVEINQDDFNLNLNETKMLTATVLAETATNRKLNWSSSNNNIVSVDTYGRVNAKALGSATIYAEARDGSGVSDSIFIRVIKPVASISVSPSSVTVREGNTFKVSATITPADATFKEIEWTSSDTSVAVVDYDGEITGVKEGICKVYATSTDGNDVVGVVKVTVKPTVPATGVTINSKSITMLSGQTRKLTARLRPSKSTESVTWLSADTSVATVSSDGTVTARGQGNTEIYAISSVTGVESSCEVIVLALNATYVTLEQYDSYDLDVFGATGKIKWYSNNKRVATVTPNGQVIARMAGTTTITAKVNGKVLYCTVRVTNMSR